MTENKKNTHDGKHQGCVIKSEDKEVKKQKESLVEKIYGNVLTQSISTYAAAASGLPILSLIPGLSGSLAANRQKIRIEKALEEINSTLQVHEKLISKLSDSQLHLISESISSLMCTSNKKKIQFLKNCVNENIKNEIVDLDTACILTRIIRDVTAEEIYFLIYYSNYGEIELLSGPEFKTKAYDGAPISSVDVSLNSDDGILVSGLIALGLIVNSSNKEKPAMVHEFSPLCIELLAVLGSKANETKYKKI